jgi:nitrogen fixation/metabolism regulation signal transduction histidine kinase
MGTLHLGSSLQRLSWDKKDEIGLLVAAYNTMVEQLEASLNQLAESERQGAWREMAKQVAHEIKNPLTPMRLSLQHLQQAIRRGDENLVEKFQRTSELLIQQIDALSNMAEEFSSFAKMPDPVMARHDLVEVLSSAVALMGKEHASPLEWSPPRMPCWVWVDQQQLGRVFNNLIKNAIQSIPEDRLGHIRVELQAEEARFQVRITDNGKGIAEELRSKIFSPNFSTKNSGMGLGLAMSKKMIEQFGGEIWFRSELGQGTIFYVSLPVISESESTLSEA